MATPQLIDTTQLAKLLDITPTWVRKLTSDGVLTRARDADGKELMGRYTLLAVRDYCRYLRSVAKLDDASEARYSALRNERMAAEGELSRLKLREYKGELHNARDIEFVMNNMLTYFKQRVLSIPSRVARLCVGKSFRQIYDLIMTEIELALRELSGYDRTMFAAQRASYLKSQGVDLESLNGESSEESSTDNRTDAEHT
jgi:phage terminase Nu1 subunit (DNA packaging protein)